MARLPSNRAVNAFKGMWKGWRADAGIVRRAAKKLAWPYRGSLERGVVSTAVGIAGYGGYKGYKALKDRGVGRRGRQGVNAWSKTSSRGRKAKNYINRNF